MKSKLFTILITIAACLPAFTVMGGSGTAGGQSIHAAVTEAATPPAGFKASDTAVATAASVNQTVTINNPTFSEVRDFILGDITSRNDFAINEYECRHFATEVNNNAEAAGLRCAIVILGYEKGQHAVVAFETTDRGLIYIEPQTDAVIRPVIGGRYQGQEIKEILLAW